MMMLSSAIEPRKKEMVRNLYSSGIPVDIIAMQVDLSITSVLKVIEEIEAGVLEISCPYCHSIFKGQKKLLKHVGLVHVDSYY
ncbi:MAG: hypothetical protein ACE5J2_07370 [Nitrososphaerales archaeon]